MNKTIAAIAFGVASLIGATAQAQAPSWNGSYDDPPRGSYTRSCREITAFDGRVWALCQSGGGRWTWSSARTSDCRGGGLENYDGRLSCAGNGGGGGWNGGGQGGGGGNRPSGGWRGDIVLFEDSGYEGRPYEVIGDIPDLGAVKFNDRASSIKIVRGNGRWEICEHTNYQGRCSKLDADQFTLPREWNDQISSIRRVR